MLYYAKRSLKDNDLILRFFLCIPASAVYAAAVNPKGIKTLLANGLITFFINGNPVSSNGPSNLLRNPPDFIIFDNWVFENLIRLMNDSQKIYKDSKPVCQLIIIYEEN